MDNIWSWSGSGTLNDRSVGVSRPDANNSSIIQKVMDRLFIFQNGQSYIVRHNEQRNLKFCIDSWI